MLRLQRIGHVVAFQLLFHVVEQRGQVGAACHIGDAQRAAALHLERPVRTAGYGFFPQHILFG